MPKGIGTYGTQRGRPSKRTVLRTNGGGHGDTGYHADDLIASQKPNEASMDEHGISSMKAEGDLTASRHDTGGRVPFQMRSGNSPMFKQMGSSPMDFKYAGKDYKNVGEYIKTIQGVTGSGDITTGSARKAQLKSDFGKTKVGQVIKKIGSIFKK